MSKEILGIHHVTAIAGDPQRNVDFYAGLLGLRLVKLTVNYDDPSTYHLYYGDGAGHPGTIMTFFPWPGAQKGRDGNGVVSYTSFLAPKDALLYWTERLKEHRISFEGPYGRFDEQVISFSDPDGVKIEIVTGPPVNPVRRWEGGPVPLEYALHGFHGATLAESAHEATASMLTGTLGFKLLGNDGNRFRYAVGSGEPGTIVDVVGAPSLPRGRVSVGTVHHIAWRTPDDSQQLEWHGEISRLGVHISPVMDRKYFHSIYFREPGGVLFEIATDPPGFTVDQTAEELGSSLVLPAWLEPQRGELLRKLPPIQLPAAVQGA